MFVHSAVEVASLATDRGDYRLVAQGMTSAGDQRLSGPAQLGTMGHLGRDLADPQVGDCRLCRMTKPTACQTTSKATIPTNTPLIGRVTNTEKLP